MKQHWSKEKDPAIREALAMEFLRSYQLDYQKPRIKHNTRVRGVNARKTSKLRRTKKGT